MTVESLPQSSEETHVMRAIAEWIQKIQRLGVLPENEFRAEYDRVAEKKRNEWMRQFPDAKETIEIMLSLPDFFLKNLWLGDRNREEIHEPYDPSLIYELTEYQAALEHFLSSNISKEYFNYFWNYFYRIARMCDPAYGAETADILKRGLLGQIALIKLFHSAGIATHAATPREDADYKIDTWLSLVDKRIAVQVKATPQPVTLEIIGDQDEIPFPAEIPEEHKGKYFFTNIRKQIALFRAKKKEYGESIQQPLEGYVVVIPLAMVDVETGEPSEALKKLFTEKISKIL